MNRAGSALLEVLIALVILSLAAVSLVSFAAAATNDQALLEQREAEAWGAERILIATVLLNRSELEQRIGAREVGNYLVEINRPETDLFRVGVSLADAPSKELLATVIYRPI